MITVSHTEKINRSLAEVYGLLACYENDPLWRSNLRSLSQDPPGLARTGTRLRQVLHLFRQDVTIVSEVTAAAPNRRTAYETVEGPVMLWEQRLFERVGRQVQVTYEVSIELQGWQRLTAPLLAGQWQRQVRTDLETVRQLIETSDDPLVDLPKRLISPSTS